MYPPIQNKPHYGYPVDRVAMIFSLLTGLLGEVSPELRSASIKWDDPCVYVYFFYDGPISEENEESAQCVATEVIACFPKHQLEVNIQRLDYPHPLPQDVGELVYRRREAKPC